MNLVDWDAKVKPHLNFIRAGAEMTARHARQLPCRFEWQTLAQEDLAEARKILETALAQINAAEAIYEAKPLENANAA